MPTGVTFPLSTPTRSVFRFPNLHRRAGSTPAVGIMEASEVVIQTEIYQTCTECEQQRRFRTDSTDEDALEVVYRCDNCDHAAVLTLDP